MKFVKVFLIAAMIAGGATIVARMANESPAMITGGMLLTALMAGFALLSLILAK